MVAFSFAGLYDYAVWANDRVLAAAERLTPEQWRQSLGQSFDSVHGTLVHILSSEQIWLARWQGQAPSERVQPADLPELADVRARWNALQAEVRAFLGSVGPRDWERVIAYRTLDGQPAAYPLWPMVVHMINHGTHHRAEAASMLTALGVPPKSLDYIAFVRERQAAGGS
jgi:uncharacterized damage-inducible protein DinB